SPATPPTHVTTLSLHDALPISIQAAMYAVFHMTDPRVFFNKKDVWRIAQSAARGQAAAMTPYYTIMKLAEVGTKEEFILMVPFTDRKSTRLNSSHEWISYAVFC